MSLRNNVLLIIFGRANRSRGMNSRSLSILLLFPPDVLHRTWRVFVFLGVVGSTAAGGLLCKV